MNRWRVGDLNSPERGLMLAACVAIAGAALALAAPIAFAVVVACLAAAALAYAAMSFPVTATVLWLLAVASTPEMWLGDALGGAFAPIVAVLKASGLALAAICVLRFGPRADWSNPGLAFVLMFAVSLAHPRLPGLTLAESLRSLAGSMAPFAFSFSALSLGWARGVLRVARWAPLFVVAFGLALSAAGLHAAFPDLGGARLAGSGHPAFLAGFAMAAIYACLIELLRDGRRGHLALLAVNAVILLLTGARAPLAVAGGVVTLGLLLAPSTVYPRARRTPLLLGGGLACVLLVALAGQLPAIRLFSVLGSDAGGLSGRDRLWPLFERARDDSPWVGWGVGAGNFVVPPDGLLAHLTGTVVAHNEYLRIGVEGGWIGLGLLVAAFAVWTWRHTRRIRASDRVVLRLVMAGAAIHAYTDNTLIATTAVMMFAFVSAAFARGEIENKDMR